MRRSKTMRKYNMGIYAILTVFGFMMMIIGFALAVTLPEPQGTLRSLPFVLIGVGAGIFGGSISTVIGNHLLDKNPNLAKQMEIDTKDERNVAISNKAKAKAYDLMIMAYGALMLAFALMHVTMWAILLFVAVYLCSIFSMVFYLNKYYKEM
jgi:phosphatidylglycerophosphate synthase